MPISANCEACGHEHRVADSVAGRHFRCQNCGATVSVGHNGATPDSGPCTDTLVPAVCIYIVVGLSIPVMLAIIVQTSMQPVDPADLPPPGSGRDAFLIGRRIGQFLFAAMFMVCYAMELVGAYHLHAHRSRTLALIGAILCCVPCLSPCLVMGIPFGIWALVVLNMSHVKERFG